MKPLVGSFVPSTPSRFGAYMIDSVIRGLLVVPAVGWVESFWEDDVEFSWPLLAYVILAPLAYDVLSVWLTGTSVGKWVSGMRVTPLRDLSARPTLMMALTRALALRLDFFCSWGLRSTAFLRYDRAHWADLWAGTRVVSLHGQTPPKTIRPWVFWTFGLLGFYVGFYRSALLMADLEFDREGVYFAGVVQDNE